MVRTTKPAKTADAAPVAEPVSTPVVADKALKVKKTKKEAAPAPVVETAPADDAVADSSDVDVAPVAEKSIEFLAKLQQLGALLSTLKAEYRSLEKQWTRELKAAQKQSSKRKRKAGNRAPSGFVKPTRISDELASFLEKPAGTEMARTEVTREINVYIRNHNLQDKANGRKINPDSKLASLLKLKKTDELTYFNLQKYMSPHFAKAVKVEATA
jgi:chromatin remodeling complex protein RSC6